MKVIIAGSRKGINYSDVLLAILSCPFTNEITEVVSGKAQGADTYGEDWAKEKQIKIVSFPANWEKYGNKAGPIRNIEMANYADALIAIWDGKSRGTQHMINCARERNLKLYVFIYNANIEEEENV